MRHAQNAEGRFWIDQEICVGCSSCFEEAPDNMRYDPSTGKSYVYKQPENDAEIAAVREAMDVCPVEAPREDA